MNETITMLVVAAGQGRRVGGPLPKQYLPLRGRPILWHTLARLQEHADIDHIVPVIAPDGDELWCQHMADAVKSLPKVAAPVAGGAERQLSVFNGLRSLALADDAWIGIHDGARPLLDRPLLDRLFQARYAGDAWIVAMPITDTVKRVDERQHIVETLDRGRIWSAQTPQLFRYGLLLEAHHRAEADGFSGTDDSSLVERLGKPVGVVTGSGDNIKITHPRDLELADFILREKKP